MRGGLPLAAVVLLLCGVLPRTPGAAAETALIQFELRDQFDRPYRDTQLRGESLVVVGSGRKGSEFQADWMAALRAGLRDHLVAGGLRIVEVADLRGVPFFLKGTVKKKFPEDRAAWVLMDWKGRFGSAYELDGDLCSVLVFDAGGHLVYRASGSEVDSRVLDRIRAAVDGPPGAGL